MRQILKREYNLPTGSIIYREKSDCSYWKIVEYNDNSGCYGAFKLDENGNHAGERGFFTPQDLIGDYVEV